MNVVPHSVTLDLFRGDSQQEIVVRQRDSVHRLYITLRAGTEQYRIRDDVTAVFVWNEADSSADNDVPGTITENTVVIDVPTTATDTPGIVECELRLYGTGGNRIAAPRFTLYVYDRLLNHQEEDSETDYPTAYERIMASWNAAIVATADANNAANAANIAAVAAREIVNGLVAITNAEIDDICDEEDET